MTVVSVINTENMSKSRVWNYFKKINNETFVKCSLCLREFKFSGNTTNLKDHLQRKHAEKWSVEQETDTVTNTNEDEDNQQESGQSIPKKRKTLKNYFDRSNVYPDNSKTKNNIDKMYVRMIALDMEPLRKGEHQGFQDFVKALNEKYEIPNTSTLKNKLLPECYDLIKQKLLSALSETEHVSLTTDMWTSISNEGILAVTCHFFYKDKFIAPLLDAVKVEGHHNAENISSVLNTVMIKWGIRTKCEAITTDNARAMINAVDKLQIRHIPCFAHTINLTVTDSFAVSCFDEILKKCKALVTFYRMSTLANDKLREKQRQLNKPEAKLIQEVPTRWNSAYHMLQRIIDVKEELSLAITESERSPPGLSAYEYSVIQEIVQILEPFDLATTKISGEAYVTLSLILPLIRGIKSRLAEIENKLHTYEGKSIMSRLKESVDTRLKPYEKRTPTVLATILDPRFKKKVFRTNDDENRGVQWLEKAYSNHLVLNPKESPDFEAESTATPSTSSGKKQVDLLGFLDIPERATPLSDAIVDIRQYLEKPVIDKNECPFVYWKQTHNRLKEIAKAYLCISATSVPSERIFSKAGQIITDRRNRLKEKNINMLLFLKQNIQYFD